MSIICRNGATQHTHETANDVRACYGAPSARAAIVRNREMAVAASVSRSYSDAPNVPVFPEPQPEPKAQPATEAQVRFIRTLLAERAHDFNTAVIEGVLPSLTKPVASTFIKNLQGLPRVDAPAVGHATAPAPEMPEVPAGRYAVEHEGVLKFYVVDRPTEGRWAGYTFLKVQASDETFPIKAKALKAEILALIAQDPQEAMLRYGREIGACGHCGRTLTNPESRARGIGPVCAGHMGF